MKITVVLLLTLASAISCSGVSTDPELEKINTSIITTRYSSEHIPKNGIFKWAPGQNKFYDDERMVDTDLDTIIKTGIINELNNKGYVFESEASTTSPQFLIGYVAGLKSSLADSKIENDYGVYPGLPDNTQNIDEKEKGTIIVNIFNPSNGQVIWRGAGQAFVMLKEMPQKERAQRVRDFMRKMFADFP